MNVIAYRLQILKGARIAGFRLFGELLELLDALLLRLQLILTNLFGLKVRL